MAAALESVFTFLFKYPPRAFEQGVVTLQPALSPAILAVLALGAGLVAVLSAARLRVHASRDRWILGALRLLTLALIV